MKAKKKIELINEILERYEEEKCFYCGSTLNGDFDPENRDDGYSEDWCPNCCEEINPNNEWDEVCLEAIIKVINDEKFKP